jgi:hypothetical protein
MKITMDLAAPESLSTRKGRWLLNIALSKGDWLLNIALSLAMGGSEWRWLLNITVSLAMGVSAAAYAWSLCKPTVTVQTLIHVPSRPQRARLPDLEHHQQQQVSLLKSRPRLSAFLRDPLVADLPVVTEQPDPVGWLEANLQADFRLAPEVLRIALSGDKPDELALLLNELREKYLREIARREAKPHIQRLIALEALLNQVQPEELRKRMVLEKAALKVELRAPRRSKALQPAGITHRTPNTLRATVATLTGLTCALLCFGFLSPTPVFTPDRLRSFMGGPFRRRVRA